MHTFSHSRHLRGLVALVTAGSILLAGAACGGDAGDDDTPTPTGGTPTGTAPANGTASPTATATPGSGTYPDDTRTNIPSVDAVIDRVLAGDVASLKLQLEYTSIACETDPDGIGGPPECRAGEADGTIVQAFLSWQCEGFWVREDGVDDILERLVEGGPELYAVYRVNEPLDALPADGHGVVFVAPDKRGLTVRVTNDGILAIGLGCNPDPAEALMGQNDFVLSPLD